MTKFEIDIGLKPAHQEFMQLIYSKLSFLTLDMECMALASEWYAKLKGQNQLIGLPDLLIAATALHHQMPLATFNTRHFERITGLELVN